MKFILLLLLLFSFQIFAFCSPSPSKIKIGKPVELSEIPEALKKAESKTDPFQSFLIQEMKDLVGHDDLIFDNISGTGYASGMDGWIWKLDFKTGKAERWFDPPLNPAGMSFLDNKKDKIIFCSSRLGGEKHPDNEKVGLYEIEITTKKFRSLVKILPKSSSLDFGKVYTAKERKPFLIKDLKPENSRSFSLCNDIAISPDADRIYITEPFERDDAAMGSGAVPEAIGLFPHGKLWLYDRKSDSVTLILSGFTFIDGILLEKSANQKEESVVFTETTRFRIIRAFLEGEKSGKSEVVLDNLPGLADGMERDEQGKIWVGIIKPRSKVINFIHRNPWIKPFVLSLPQSILPVAKNTGILVLNPEAEKVLYFKMHDGSKIRDISVAVPNGKRIYFPVFDKTSRGLFSIPSENFSLIE